MLLFSPVFVEQNNHHVDLVINLLVQNYESDFYLACGIDCQSGRVHYLNHVSNSPNQHVSRFESISHRSE